MTADKAKKQIVRSIIRLEQSRRTLSDSENCEQTDERAAQNRDNDEKSRKNHTTRSSQRRNLRVRIPPQQGNTQDDEDTQILQLKCTDL